VSCPVSSGRGVLHVVQVAIDAVMDVAAKLTKNHGHRVRDDDYNLDELVELALLDAELFERLATLNGLRNAIAHEDNKFEEAEVLDNSDRIDAGLLAFVETIDAYLEERVNPTPEQNPPLPAVRDDLGPRWDRDVLL
jgi:uncharacterized protein YutE (UPF0331/DUF86 family)